MIMRLYSTLAGITNSPLCRDRKIDTVFRFAKWQFGSRLTGRKLVVNWINDAKLVWKNGDHGLSGNLYCGLSEYEDMAFMLHFLRTEDEFYDIGANAGAYTVLAAAVLGCKSYAHEPIPSTFNKLVEQVSINGVGDKAETNNSGIGSTVGVLKFTDSLDDLNHVANERTSDSVTEVETTTLDSKYDPQMTSLVKIDVEGYEDFVLEGGRSFFSNPKVAAVILELNGCGMRYGVSDASLDKKIRGFGFSPVAYDPPSRGIKPLEHPNTTGNTIYIRNLADAKRRCASADSFVVHTANGATI